MVVAVQGIGPPLSWNGMGLEGELLGEMTPCRSRPGNRWEQLVRRPQRVREAMERYSPKTGKFPEILCESDLGFVLLGSCGGNRNQFWGLQTFG